MILPHVVVKKPEKKWWVGLIKICFYTQYKTVLPDRLFLLDIFHIPLRCNRTEMREIIQCTSFALINGTVTFVHFKTKSIISDLKVFLATTHKPGLLIFLMKFWPKIYQVKMPNKFGPLSVRMWSNTFCNFVLNFALCAGFVCKLK